MRFLRNRPSRSLSAGLVALAVGAVLGPVRGASLSVDIGAAGSVSLSVDGKAWLESNRTALHFNGGVLSSDDGGLVLVGPGTKSTGQDKLGSFQATRWSWAAASAAHTVIMQTGVRIYAQHANAVVFEQSFPAGVKSVGTKDWLMSDFPFFNPKASGLSSAVFSGHFVEDNQVNHGTGLDKCKTSTQGGPVLLYDEGSLVTLVASGLTSIKTAEMYCSGHLSMGLKGTLTSVPAGYSASWVLSLDTGVKRAMESWGALLLGNAGKQAATPYGDEIRDTLGFWTDNGGWFHYIPQPVTTGEYETKLMQAAADYKQAGIPIRHWQGDSWWYPKGPGGGTGSSQSGSDGMYHWVADPLVFPDGMKGFQGKLGLPFILHNRWITADNWYKENKIAGDADQWTPPNKHNLPFDQAAYWSYFFAQQAGWGLVTYEQDFLFSQYDGIPALQTNATFADDWLAAMANHAASANLTMQYCMPYPREYLASTQFQNVVTIRATGDYGANNPNWQVQPASLLAHACGVLPFKDTFLSSNDAEPGGASRAQGPELSSDLHALISTLTASTVGPGDGPGMMNGTRLMQTCRADGLLLKPDRAAVPLDVTWTSKSPGQQLSWTTATSADGASKTVYVLAADLGSAYDVMPHELELEEDGGSYVAMHWYNRTMFPFNAKTPLRLSRGTPHGGGGTGGTSGAVSAATASPIPFEYWVVAAVRKSGWALLGELSKFVTAAGKRVASVSDASNGELIVALTGAPGERVSVCAAWAKTSQSVCAEAIMDAAGAAKATLVPPATKP